MEIMSLAIAVFAVIIGLVIGYVSISAKMKSSQEAAELMLLNAEQEATNLRGQAEREADLLVNSLKERQIQLRTISSRPLKCWSNRSRE
ncbi:putative HD superfamily hydrolase [Streptococcus pneumoniae]|nr:putative HD superfamily hydrolase [Streptococcus pneumoniae]